ncbi:MAG: hypothetical protein AAFQ89_06410, partial [Cyanobacteria bacterium J06626_18]
MMFTNPGKTAYTDYASERLHQELQEGCNDFEDDISVGAVFTLPSGDLCKSVVGGADFFGRG